LPAREDGAAVDEHCELSEAAPADPRGHAERRLELFAEAYRLAPQINSERAALDLDVRHARVVDHIAGEGKRLDETRNAAVYPSTRRIAGGGGNPRRRRAVTGPASHDVGRTDGIELGIQPTRRRP